MADEGDYPTTDTSMAASTKRLANWTFSLQGVGADLKGVMNDLKDYWRKLTPTTAGGVSMAALIPDPDEQRTPVGVRVRQGAQILEQHTVEHSKLLPWLMLTAVLSGIAAGISIMVVVEVNQSESRTRVELDKQNRFLQEYRIRVEDAEIAAEEVNPKFHPRRTE